jgi:hypothetical protein
MIDRHRMEALLLAIAPSSLFVPFGLPMVQFALPALAG